MKNFGQTHNHFWEVMFQSSEKIQTNKLKREFFFKYKSAVKWKISLLFQLIFVTLQNIYCNAKEGPIACNMTKEKEQFTNTIIIFVEFNMSTASLLKYGQILM